MRKCDYCGREGNAPNVRGAKSAAVSIGNYRMPVDIDVTICEECADKIMYRAIKELVIDIAGSDAR